MAEQTYPFRIEHWNLLATAANNYKDKEIFPPNITPYSTSVEFHDQVHWLEWGQDPGRPDARYNTQLNETILTTPSVPLVTESTPFTRSMLQVFQDRVDEVWNNSHPTGDVPSGVTPPTFPTPLQAPWPSNDTRISKSTMRGFMNCIHWSPYEWTRRWVLDNLGFSGIYFYWLEIGETSIHVTGDAYNHDILAYDYEYSSGDDFFEDEYLVTIKKYLKQPHGGLVQVFPGGVVRGAKLDWIARDYSFAYDYRYGTGEQYDGLYPNVPPYIYRIMMQVDIEEDGSCILPTVTKPDRNSSVPVNDPSVIGPWSFYVKELLVHDIYREISEGDDTRAFDACWALNLSEAEFI